METIHQTPTSRSDYAVLSATYMSLLGGLALAQHRKGRGEPIPAAEIVPLAAATFAMSKLVVHEKVETWMRAPFVEERPDGRRPKGRRLRYAIGELLTCTRCTGAWTALALVGLRMHAPGAGRVVTTVLATSAGNDFAQSAFSLLCGSATRTDRQAEAVGRDLAGNGAGHPRGAAAHND
jgi:hypothetical protein